MFGFKLVRERDVAKQNLDYDLMKDQHNFMIEKVTRAGVKKDGDKMFGAGRPPINQVLMPTGSGAKLPIEPRHRMILYEMVKDIDALRIPIDVKNREVLRNGFEIAPVFMYRCEKCGTNYQSKPIDEDHPDNRGDHQNAPVKCSNRKCGNKDLKEPEPRNRKILSDLMERAWNENGQTIDDVMSELERDFDITDDGYLLVKKDYHIEGNKIIKEKVTEIMTLHPPHVGIIADNSGRMGWDDQLNRIFICPKHRMERIKLDPLNKARLKLDPETGYPKCPKCACETLPAIIEVNSIYSPTISEARSLLYAKGEVVFSTGKYWRTKMFGYSVIHTVWSKAQAMRYMDDYVRTYFDRQRPPKGLLVIGSRNYESLSKALDKLKTDAEEDPYGLHTLMVETERGGNKMVQYIDLTGNLSDLQFTDIREEFKRVIGASFGIMQLFGGDIPTGWSQESLQMTVTNRAISYDQRFMREKILKRLCKLHGVHDWIIELKTGEETDELRDAQYKQVQIANAVAMHSIGYTSHLDGDGEFVFSMYPKEMDEMGATTPSGKKSEKKPKSSKETMTQHSGEHLVKRPSDTGGTHAGSPSSGPNTSMSKKSVRLAGYNPRKHRGFYG